MNNPNFFVGVWAQPVASFPKWKAEGVNLIVGPDRESNTRTAQQVRQACGSLGLFYMDSPESSADLEALIADPFCIRIMLPDEPELKAPNYNVDPTGFMNAVNAFVAKWKPFYDQAKGRKKFWVNFSGPKVTGGRPAYKGQNQIPFGAIADEVCADWYPINMNTARYWDQYNAANLYSLPVTMVQCLKEYFPGKPVWSYIEVCDQHLNNGVGGRGPTELELQKQSLDLVKQGLSGIIYFAHRIGGGLPWDPAGAAGKTAWDGRTPEQQAICQRFAFAMNPPPIDKFQAQIDLIKVDVEAMKEILNSIGSLLEKLK